MCDAGHAMMLPRHEDNREESKEGETKRANTDSCESVKNQQKRRKQAKSPISTQASASVSWFNKPIGDWCGNYRGHRLHMHKPIADVAYTNQSSKMHKSIALWPIQAEAYN